MPRARDSLSLDHLLAQLVKTDDGWCAHYDGITVSSVFQPVAAITQKRVVGYEALVRATDAQGAALEPEALFALAQARGDELVFDRLTRCIHTANFAEQHVDAGWLFLNVSPRLLDSGMAQSAFIEALCAHFSLPPSRIVLEVIEQASHDEAELARVIDMIQDREFLIAIDDFGTGFSNFNRVWQAKPDIVKLDRSLVERSLAERTQSGKDRRIIHHLIAMLHQAGTMVLAEGIEDIDALLQLMDADIDFAQGFVFGQPDKSVERSREGVAPVIEAAWQRFAASQHERIDALRPSFDTIERLVLVGAADFAAARDFDGAARRLLASPSVRRVFMTDSRGEQSGPAVVADGQYVDESAVRRLAPLVPDAGSNWSRRPYFQRALAAPGRVAVMGPYFSAVDGRDCYTGAVALQLDGDMVVFCVDFALDGAGHIAQ